MIIIKRVIVKGEFETEIEVSNVNQLEECRTKLAEAYGNGHAFEIFFHIQTENFDQIKYPEDKRRK